MHKLSPRYNEDKQEKGANSAHRRLCSTSSGTVGAWRLLRCRRRPILLLAVFAFVCIYVLFLWIPSVTTGFWHWPWLREKHLEILPSWLHMALSYLLARAAPSVDISQGTVVGTVLTDSSLPRPIEAFLGVPYGQPPAGERRFKRAQPVKPSVAVIDASKYGKRCPAGPLGWTADDWGEDCLNLNLFRPKDRPHNTKLPVAVYLHGGAFNGGAGRYHSSANMISWSEEPFIIVNFNYRLGALGFLPSTITEKENALNLGLHDQILLFEWVQKNIGAFGGDPSQVTLFGLSAGAHSIGHHVMHKTRSKRLFHRAIIDSGATTARAVYPPNNALHKRQFEEFLLEAKCSNISDEFDDFLPCLDPTLPPSDLRLLNKIYPDPLKDPESPYVEHRQINVGPQYKRITAAYGQFAYVCPVRQTAHLASEGQREPVYLYHWALNKTVKGGASHGDQGEYEVYGRGARQFSKTQETIAGFIHAYITSFITKGDPNHIKGEYADRPRWDRFRMKSARSVMVFGDGNDERAGGGHVGVAAQMGDIKWCEEECNFWSDRSILTES
uniref:Carboxylic ester hydrolase n=1 Tax=Coccidioides posadasii RMSCC 3488 TaxID=454284 RepID=A0A0J6F4P9_COCPO|nr:carboxylesterase 1 [Coccidioides posadasii RMSCC 3488]